MVTLIHPPTLHHMFQGFGARGVGEMVFLALLTFFLLPCNWISAVISLQQLFFMHLSMHVHTRETDRQTDRQRKRERE